MKAIVIENFGGMEQMKLADIDIPEPGADEVQIEVAYAAVNPVDWKIREGYLKNMLTHDFPIVLGWDVSGKVTKVGEQVTQLKMGDEVYAYCRKPVVKWGTFAEYVCFSAEHVALKPKTLSFAQSAGIPLVALTAWQALFDFGELKNGQTVLVHAGAGGVGGMACQFAHYIGAKVFTTASRSHHQYVSDRGADVAIDYREEDFVERVKELVPDGVDMVFDCVGGETLKKSISCVKKGGALATICDPLDASDGEKFGIKTGFVFVAPNGKQLAEIGELIDQGKVIPSRIEEFPLEKAAEALEKNKEGHTEGKLVLKVNSK